MKKAILAVLGLLVAFSVEAQINSRAQLKNFASSGSGTNVVIIKEGSGVQVIENFNYTIGAVSATIKYFPASIPGRVHAATAAASTNQTIISDSAGKISGYTLAANDYLILCDTSTNAAGYQLRKVAAVGAVTTNAAGTNLVVQLVAAESAGTASANSNDVAFVVKSADIVSRTVTASTTVPEYNVAAGNFSAPLAVTLTETGTASTVVSGLAGLYQ